MVHFMTKPCILFVSAVFCFTNGLHLNRSPSTHIKAIDTWSDKLIELSSIEDLPLVLADEYQSIVSQSLIGNFSYLSYRNKSSTGNISKNKMNINDTLKTDGLILVEHSTSSFSPNLTKEQVRLVQGRRMMQIMDIEADPCDDFYQYACGNWESHNPLPADSAGFDTFEKLRESLNMVLRNLLEQRNFNDDDSGAIVKAKHLYQSCMDTAKLEELKEKPLLQLLQTLGGWPILSPDTSCSGLPWADLLSRLRLYNNDILISMWIGPDGKNSESHIIQLDQGDLVLPSRAYYLGKENFTSVLTAYSEFIKKTALALGGKKEVVEKDIICLLEFETELAMILTPAEDRRNFSSMYHKLTVSELNFLTGTVIPWERYLGRILNTTLYGNETVVVYAMDYFQKLAFLLNKTEKRTITNYVLWRFVRHRLNNLDRKFQDLKQDLYTVLYGREKQPERWKYCVSYVNANMGMAVGSLFVKHFFSRDSKNDTIALIYEIQSIFLNILNSVEWLDYETKDHAKEKLMKMNVKVGYPDYILENHALDSDYEEVVINNEAYFENVLRMLKFVVAEELAKLKKPVDRQQWSTTPAVVNAYYSRTRNQIMLPAGILQPPFYHSSFPKAINFGGIGVVIGHEMTHGFDDQGRQFDSSGNLLSWWPEETAQHFLSKTQCIIEQYNNYTDQVADVEIRVNGDNTQGENIADNGGIRQAFKAYEKWLDSHPDLVDDERLPGLNITAKQLFFLSFGQIWCGTIRPEAALSKMKTAVHAPGRFRVIGSLSNMEEFSHIYGCPIGSLMNPLDRCIVW